MTTLLSLLLLELHTSWGKRAAHNRAQIVYYIAENLELRRDEVAQRINTMTGIVRTFCRLLHVYD